MLFGLGLLLVAVVVAVVFEEYVVSRKKAKTVLSEDLDKKLQANKKEEESNNSPQNVKLMFLVHEYRANRKQLKMLYKTYGADSNIVKEYELQLCDILNEIEYRLSLEPFKGQQTLRNIVDHGD